MYKTQCYTGKEKNVIQAMLTPRNNSENAGSSRTHIAVAVDNMYKDRRMTVYFVICNEHENGSATEEPLPLHLSDYQENRSRRKVRLRRQLFLPCNHQTVQAADPCPAEASSLSWS